MDHKNYSAYFLILVLLVLSVLTFYVFKPFLTAIIVATILAVIFQKPYNFFIKITKKRKGLSALITSLAVVLVVVIPFSIIIGFIVGEII